MTIKDGCLSWLDKVKFELGDDDPIIQELVESSPVIQAITYHRFVSRSKGWRNGKRRIRKHWKEIRLIKYARGFTQWHRFPFDEYATEILGEKIGAEFESLQNEIIREWGL